jgi:hypothetical protein
LVVSHHRLLLLPRRANVHLRTVLFGVFTFSNRCELLRSVESKLVSVINVDVVKIRDFYIHS